MPLQMAIDELFFNQFLASEIFQPVFRFYFSSEPWITIGYSHPEHDSNNPGVPVCRRITGGGTVRHGNDLLFSLIARKEDDETFKSVRESYWKIHEAVKLGFEKAGASPRFYRCDEKLPRGGECFVYPIATDLALEDKKIAGGAQKRSRGILMHQESLQISNRFDLSHFVIKLKQSFQEIFQIQFKEKLLDPAFLENAAKLSQDKYEKSPSAGARA